MKKALFLNTIFVMTFIITQAYLDSPAHAIECNDQFQIIKGHGELSTPYCQISYLTEVSHEFGYKHSFHEIRKSFFLKQKICDHIGDDIRISSICHSFKSDQGSNFFD
ncbi:MAG: hypothetical protein AAF228_09310 [Pseudomonadota bacterium]